MAIAKETQHVVFSASISASRITASPDAIIHFDHVIGNQGNGFDPHTGVFTAPYDGDYMFLVSVDVSDDYKRLRVEKSGHTVFYGHNDGPEHHITTGAAFRVKAGDTVSVHHDKGVVGYVDGGPESIFTGFRIR
nr:hypothetical protein BaRGS_000249 [Batillaria attramentaria]